MEDIKEFYCHSCGKTEKWPFCCGQYMTQDESAGILFCEICGKESPLPTCCGEVMVPREAE